MRERNGAAVGSPQEPLQVKSVNLRTLETQRTVRMVFIIMVITCLCLKQILNFPWQESMWDSVLSVPGQEMGPD